MAGVVRKYEPLAPGDDDVLNWASMRLRRDMFVNSRCNAR
jgi:hypothetical protein